DLGDLGRREDSTLFAQVAAKTPGLDHHYAVEDSDAAAADWSTVNGDDRAYVDRQSVQRPPQGCGGLPCLSTGLGHLAVLSVGAVPQGSAVGADGDSRPTCLPVLRVDAGDPPVPDREVVQIRDRAEGPVVEDDGAATGQRREHSSGPAFAVGAG